MRCSKCSGPVNHRGELVNDPHYTGPRGHFVSSEDQNGQHVYEGPQLCYDCWVTEWALSEVYTDAIDMICSMILQNATRAEIAKRLGVSRTTLWKRMRVLFSDPQIISDWCKQNVPSQLPRE